MFFIDTKYVLCQIWRGNRNGNSIKRNNFGRTIQTRYFRIYPEKTTSRFRCLRVEIYGCWSQGSRFPCNFYPQDLFLAKVPVLNFTSRKLNLARIENEYDSFVFLFDRKGCHFEITSFNKGGCHVNNTNFINTRYHVNRAWWHKSIEK